jgi:hypothetical protein
VKAPQKRLNSFVKGTIRKQGDAQMDISAISSNTAMAAMVRQLQTVSEVQTAVMRQVADSQQQMADLLAAAGIGQTIDIQA